MSHECLSCKRELSVFRDGQKYCSASCREAHWRARNWGRTKIPETRGCLWCKAEFSSTDSRKKYCKIECKVAHHNAERQTTQFLPRPCAACGTPFKPLQKRGIGRSWCSLECRQALLAQYKPESRLRRAKQSAAVRKHLRGITPADYQEMVERQGGKCAICGRPETASRNGRRIALAVDHDHETGQIRKLLCTTCNTGLGSFRENPALLAAAFDYLKGHFA